MYLDHYGITKFIQIGATDKKIELEKLRNRTIDSRFFLLHRSNTIFFASKMIQINQMSIFHRHQAVTYARTPHQIGMYQ